MFSRLNVRTKLLVMLLPAALGLCGLAGLGVKTRLDDRSAAQLDRDASTLAASASAFVHELQRERLLEATVAVTPSDDVTASLVGQRRTTDEAADALERSLARSRPALAASGPLGADLAALDGAAGAVDEVRATGADSPLELTGAYSDLIGTQLAAVGRIELAMGGDGRAAVSRRWLAEGIEAESALAATAASLLPADERPGDDEAAATVAELSGRAALFFDSFRQYADPAGIERFDAARESAAASDALFADLADVASAIAFSADPTTWPDLVDDRVSAVEAIETDSYRSEVARLSAAADDADSAAVYFAAGAAGSCLLVLLLAFGVSRQIATTLRRLTEVAREISDEQVPALVQGLKSGSGVHGMRFTEVDTGSSDEFAEVGNALNELGRAMVTVATEQQQSLRKGISDIFVNLARRNQTLLDRQIQFIDRLEANEQDPDQLENLFRLDHLATRMRRNAESLLVLAGAEAPRRRARDVELSDVIRVAVGEVEDFARISLMAVEEAETVGGAAVDIAHLLAELMENGAQYSPPERTVDIVGHRTIDGGYVISITDHGVGMTPDRLNDANRLLASPPPVGLALSRALGFVVAGTLANRHGITIRLGASSSGGVTAEVSLPTALIRPVEAPPVPTPAPFVPAPTIVAETLHTEVARAETTPTEIARTEPTRTETPVLAGWTADGEYVEVAAATESITWATESITWGEERLPAAPAPSKLIDMLPEGPAFEQGLYSLLGQDAPAAPSVPDTTSATSAPSAASAASDQPPPYEPAQFEPRDGGPTPPAPTGPPIPGLWAPPIVHPRPPAAIGPEPSAAPALPQRAPRTAAAPAAPPTERTAAPQRPADEVRSVLSRYRDGLGTGRTDGAAPPPPLPGPLPGNPSAPFPDDTRPDTTGGTER